MRYFVLAMLLSTTAIAAPYPPGSPAEMQMRSFVPGAPSPIEFSFLKYYLQEQELDDVGLHFNDIEIMLFDLPVPAEPLTKKAPE